MRVEIALKPLLDIMSAKQLIIKHIPFHQGILFIDRNNYEEKYLGFKTKEVIKGLFP